MQEYKTSELLEELERRSIKAREGLLNLDKGDFFKCLDFFAQIEAVENRLEKLHKTFKEFEQKLSYDILPNVFEINQATSMTRNGKTFYIGARFNARINPDKRQEAFQWLKEHQLGHLIKDDVNSKTLSSQVNDYFKENAMLPPEDLIPIHKQTYTGVRKA